MPSLEHARAIAVGATIGVLLCMLAAASGIAAASSWLHIEAGRRAFLPGPWTVCSTSSALGTLLEGRGKKADCTKWRPTMVAVVSWGRNVFGPHHEYVTDVKVRRRDGGVGFVPIGDLIPVVPVGTQLVLSRTCAAKCPASARGRLASQQGAQLTVRARSGATTSVSIYDVTDTLGHCIFRFVDPIDTKRPRCPAMQ